ncbi:MAG: GNAT family N-acetyltransferase [Erythrobacteraceae bacterium]|nr:GNAT family N-acetyltransferase [Citromicrobium sp.]MAS86112.1 GNAT family N-acetyltransferase [Erythrobacteraceae bacterium]MBT48333.1 GNAT family N-acetyltransferase [Citromicrobium sp.]
MELTARIHGGVAGIDAGDWDRLAGNDNPFVSHAFLSAMEDSGSVGPGTGWQAAPITIADEAGEIHAAMPAYLKSHSRGEFVFDQGWADAYEHAGGRYYPKLQIAAPFTPATGPRLLFEDEAFAAPLLRAAEQVCHEHGLSGAHATFIAPEQLALFEQAGWLIRSDLQFHWENDGYADFEGFLDSLASRKRKNLRKERAKAQGSVEIRHLTGEDLTKEVWDAFWEFYQDTGARKWGTPYLTREAFTLLGERMGEHILLIFAYLDGQPVAGAMNVIGGSTLFGRYWGCLVDIPFLHFELCYYQAIDAAIARGLARVEAGAQGGHKLARGYAPVQTHSAHYIADPGLRAAVAEFLERERQGIAVEQNFLEARTPFRKG